MSTTAEDLTKSAQKQMGQVTKKLGKSSKRVHRIAQKNIQRYGGKLQKDARRVRKAANKNYGQLNSHQRFALIAGLVVIVAAVSTLIGRASVKPAPELEEN